MPDANEPGVNCLRFGGEVACKQQDIAAVQRPPGP